MIRGRTALVTGAGRRVGKAIALELARAGADVVVHVNASLAEGETTANEIRALGVRAAVVQADQRSVPAIEEACREAQAALGPIRYLVNSAAIWPHVKFDETTQEDFDLAIETNLRGPYFWARHLGPEIAKAGGGAIVNIADICADRPWTNSLPYCLAKSALITMTYGMARALAPHVRVNAIGPGPVAFPDDYDPEKKAKDIRNTLVGREGSPEDVAATVRFLLEHEYITGTFLPVDGGFRFGK